MQGNGQDTMFLPDTPGDEITLYVLSKMYQHHSIVFTSAKCWTTLETGSPTSEDDLFDLCDIRLLYIEPGVFGELCKKAHMSPAPFENGIFESATAVIPSTSNATSDIEPLNLCTNETPDDSVPSVQS